MLKEAIGQSSNKDRCVGLFVTGAIGKIEQGHCATSLHSATFQNIEEGTLLTCAELVSGGSQAADVM